MNALQMIQFPLLQLLLLILGPSNNAASPKCHTNDSTPFLTTTATQLFALLTASPECLTINSIPSLTTTATLLLALLTLLLPKNALQIIQLLLLHLLLIYTIAANRITNMPSIFTASALTLYTKIRAM